MTDSERIVEIVDLFSEYQAARERMNELVARVTAGNTADDELEQLMNTCNDAAEIAAAVGRAVMEICKERSKYRATAPVLAQVIDELELEDWMKYRYEHGGCADLCTFEQYKAGYEAMKQQQQKDRRCCE